MQTSADAHKQCTVYSPNTVNSLWDGFTADNMSNADGSETLAKYAETYKATITARAERTQEIAVAAIEATFPDGSALLSTAQKSQVLATLKAESRPAAILDTAYAALDRATGAAAARAALEKAFADLHIVGGKYEAGAEPSAQDVAAVNAMYANVKSYLARRYGGYRVDIAALAPSAVKVTTGDTSFADLNGVVTIGVGTEWQTASLYGVMLHETKHAIDAKSRAPVFGAAWEGGGLAVDELVTARFVEEVMATEADRLPHYRLGREIDNVRTTATTDATLQLYLRRSCGGGSENSIDFAKSIVRSYGYTNDDTLLLRSRRAHSGMQYLSYDYGSVIVQDQIRWLQQAVGTAVTVDPYLLQACGIFTTDKSQTVLASFKACIAK